MAHIGSVTRMARGTCRRTCPAQAIELSPYPRINERCMWCYLCERICPEQAFASDWTKLRKTMRC